MHNMMSVFHPAAAAAVPLTWIVALLYPARQPPGGIKYKMTFPPLSFWAAPTVLTGPSHLHDSRCLYKEKRKDDPYAVVNCLYQNVSLFFFFFFFPRLLLCSCATCVCEIVAKLNPATPRAIRFNSRSAVSWYISFSFFSFYLFFSSARAARMNKAWPFLSFYSFLYCKQREMYIHFFFFHLQLRLRWKGVSACPSSEEVATGPSNDLLFLSFNFFFFGEICFSSKLKKPVKFSSAQMRKRTTKWNKKTKKKIEEK